MSDPRLTPDPAAVTHEAPLTVNAQMVNLTRAPDGPRDRQLVFGEDVISLGTDHIWSYVRCLRDGYHGWIDGTCLIGTNPATHVVSARCTHSYEEANFKSPDVMNLSHGSRLRAFAETEKFIETPEGFVPRQHVKPVGHFETDPAEVAGLYLGTDYLWGGNSCWGIDCSGLVQAALLACDIPCPGDSDMQMTLGAPASAPYQRNDLLFWKGHVALVHDPDTLIHANAHAMAVTYEPIEAAIARIAASGDGPVTAHRRLPAFSG